MKIETENLTRKTAFALFYNIFSAALGYVALFYVMRSVGQTGWGIVGSAMGLVGLLAILSDLGSSSTHVKKVGEGGDIEKKNGTYITLKLIFTNLFVVVTLLAIYLANYLGFKFESEYLRNAVILMIFYYYLFSLSKIFKTILRAYMKTSHALLPDFVRVIVQDIFLIVFSMYWIINPSAPPEKIGVLFVYGYIIAAFAQLLTFIFIIRDLKVKKPSIELIKSYLIFSIPLIFLGVVGTIQANTDKAMLQFFWNTREVGAYFGIQKLIVPLTTLSTALNFVIFPAQSHNYNRNRKRFMEITYTAERYASLLILPLISFIFVLAPEVLNLWKKSLIPYTTVLRILLIYSFFYVLNTPYSSQLVSAGHPKENLKAGAVQAILNVVLNAIFIPTSLLSIPLLGMKSVGAALATLLSLLAGFFLLRFRAYKILGTKFNRKILLHIFASFLSGSFLYFLNRYVYHFVRFYELALAAVIFSLIYIGLLLLMKELTLKELEKIVRKLLNLH
ncbi:MAG: polysaccharide biosynthesis protein [Thermoplasmata archaeon]|nr:polysaccharide biosynthesis protein [Thermoplasmata archaeon]